MKQRHWGQLIIFLGSALFIAYVLITSPLIPLTYCFFPFLSGVMVNVTNDGPTPVSNLAIVFQDGEKVLAKLEPGRTHTFRVKPSVESGIDVRFVDALGNGHSHKPDVYISRYSRGTITITLDYGSNITWQTAITSSCT